MPRSRACFVASLFHFVFRVLIVTLMFRNFFFYPVADKTLHEVTKLVTNEEILL